MLLLSQPGNKVTQDTVNFPIGKKIGFLSWLEIPCDQLSSDSGR